MAGHNVVFMLLERKMNGRSALTGAPAIAAQQTFKMQDRMTAKGSKAAREKREFPPSPLPIKHIPLQPG